MPWLEILIAVLGLGAGFMLRDWIDVIAATRGAGAPIDFSAAAARGELLHLDWADQRDDNQRAAG